MLFFLAFLAVANAQFLPIYKTYEYPLLYKNYKTIHTSPLVEKTLEVKTDAKAAHNFGYSTLNHARAENRDSEGNVQGSYSYISPEGKLIQRNYRANAFEGFKQDEKKYNPAITTEVVHKPTYYNYPWAHDAIYSRSYKTYVEELARKKRDTYLAYRNYNWNPYYNAWTMPDYRYVKYDDDAFEYDDDRKKRDTYLAYNKYWSPYNYRTYDNAWTMPAYRYVKYDDDDFEFDDDRKKRDTYVTYSRKYDWTTPFYYNGFRSYNPYSTWTMPAYRYIKYDDDFDRRKRDTMHSYAFATPTQTQYHSQTNLDAKHMIYKSYEMPKTYVKSYTVPAVHSTQYRYGMPMYWY